METVARSPTLRVWNHPNPKKLTSGCLQKEKNFADTSMQEWARFYVCQ